MLSDLAAFAAPSVLFSQGFGTALLQVKKGERAGDREGGREGGREERPSSEKDVSTHTYPSSRATSEKTKRWMRSSAWLLLYLFP